MRRLALASGALLLGIGLFAHPISKDVPTNRVITVETPMPVVDDVGVALNQAAVQTFLQAEEARKAEEVRVNKAKAVARDLKNKHPESSRIQTASAGTAQTAVIQSGDFYQRLAMCETGGKMDNPNTGNGYYGFFQFSLSTWRGVGGTGYPHEHSYEVQKSFAMKNITPSNFKGQHPRCSRTMYAEGWQVPVD